MKERILRRLTELADNRATARAVVNTITDVALTESRNLTSEEGTQVVEARAQITSIDEETARLNTDLAELETELSQQRDGDTDENERRAAGLESGVTPVVSIRQEPLTYERHDIQRSYFWDLVQSNPAFGGNDREASQRLERHAAEIRVELPRRERRLGTRANPTTRYAEDGDQAREERSGVSQEIEYRDLDRVATSGGEFVPPLWMVDEFVSLSRAGRVTANLCRNIPLPKGTDSINLPRVSTGSATAMQTADNAAVTETDIVTDSVSAPVRTIAGQQDVALQLLEQSPIAFDEVIFDDLAGDHASVMDAQVINGSAASGQMRGILQIGSVDTTAYTDASPTLVELWPKLADSANEVATNRFRPASAILMHPRRWFWALSSLDSSSRPFLSMDQLGPNNALFAADGSPVAQGRVGVTPFGPVYLDPNIPINLGTGTNEDRVLFTRPEEYFLFEGAVRTRVLPEILSGNLTVRLQLYSYAAFMPDRRVESTSIVSGTGLVTPTF